MAVVSESLPSLRTADVSLAQQVLNYRNVGTVARDCCLATLCVAVALVLTQALRSPVFPTPLFFASIVISTWYGGAFSGVLAVLMTAFALDYYFIPPIGKLTLEKAQTPYLFEFAIPALITCWFVKRRLLTETSLRRARDELESKVRERQAELAHVTRLLTVGELGVSIAHEVNQPLMAVVLHSDACLRWLGADPPSLDEARQAALHAIEQGNRAGEIVKRIRSLSQKTDPQRVPVHLNEAVEDIMALVGREIAQNRVSVKMELAKNLPMVLGDRVLLQQVVLNLVMNAIEAMGANGDDRRELTVRTESLGGGVTTIVEDSGAGLPPCDPEQMFAAFFTTKPQGLGMGLSISRTIIESHGGRLWANDSGHGAVFSFRLPGS